MLGLALVIIGALWVFLKKTRLGVTIRAGVDNFEMYRRWALTSDAFFLSSSHSPVSWRASPAWWAGPS